MVLLLFHLDCFFSEGLFDFFNFLDLLLVALVEHLGLHLKVFFLLEEHMLFSLEGAYSCQVFFNCFFVASLDLLDDLL